VAHTITVKLGLTGNSADAVNQLFHIPSAAASSISVASAVLLVYSGVSFTRRLQKMYLAAWGQEKAGMRGGLFAALGLLALLAEVAILYGITSVVRKLPVDWLLMIPLSAVTGLVLWTSIPYLLLNRQVHWRRLLAAGGLAATAMALFGTATTLYMPSLIERYTSDFGLFGVTIAIIGWLLAAAGMVVASTAIGAEFDTSLAPWALSLKARCRLVDPHLGSPNRALATQGSGLSSEDLVLLSRVLANWLVMAGAVWAATVVVPGIQVHGGVLTYLWVSLLLGLVNALLGPLLRLVVLNITALRLGLFALLVNGVLLALTAGVSRDLVIGGLTGGVLGALVISTAFTVRELVVRPFRQGA
jgi:membrane protein